MLAVSGECTVVELELVYTRGNLQTGKNTRHQVSTQV